MVEAQTLCVRELESIPTTSLTTYTLLFIVCNDFYPLRVGDLSPLVIVLSIFITYTYSLNWLG